MKPLLILILLGISCGAVYADSSDPKQSFQYAKLRGEYGLALSQSCIFAPLEAPPSRGFDEATGALLVESDAVSAVAKGVVRFSRYGTMTIEDGVLTEIFESQVEVGDIPVMANNRFSCEGPYELASGGKIEANLTCTVSTPNPGILVTIKPFLLSGFASRLGESIQLTSVAGNIQITEISLQGTVIQERQRACIQSLSMVKTR